MVSGPDFKPDSGLDNGHALIRTCSRTLTADGSRWTITDTLTRPLIFSIALDGSSLGQPRLFGDCGAGIRFTQPSTHVCPCQASVNSKSSSFDQLTGLLMVGNVNDTRAASLFPHDHWTGNRGTELIGPWCWVLTPPEYRGLIDREQTIVDIGPATVPSEDETLSYRRGIIQGWVFPVRSGLRTNGCAFEMFQCENAEMHRQSQISRDVQEEDFADEELRAARAALEQA